MRVFRFQFHPFQDPYPDYRQGWINVAIVGTVFVIALTLALIQRF